MEIDPQTAASLGWPKLKYAWVERERRWVCGSIPMNMVIRTEAITDLYITGTQLRLREAIPIGEGKPIRRLTRKADVDASTRLLTSIYLSAHEYALLSALPGMTLNKTRHYLSSIDKLVLSIDEFHGPLRGLLLGEVEFSDVESMAAFTMPGFALFEVTNDPRYSGGSLASNGLPATL